MLSPIYSFQPMSGFACSFWPEVVVTDFCCSTECLALQGNPKTVNLAHPIDSQALVKAVPAIVKKADSPKVKSSGSPHGTVQVPAVAAVGQAEAPYPGSPELKKTNSPRRVVPFPAVAAIGQPGSQKPQEPVNNLLAARKV